MKTLALIPLLLALSANPRSHTPLVFILAGQSNMAGRGLPIPFEKPNPQVLTLTAEGALIPAMDPLGDLGEGSSAGSGAGVGPGITFGRIVTARTHRKVILLQCALGGSSAAQWVPGQPLFNDCMARTRIAERYGQVAGVLDIQGETDAMADAPAVYQASATLWPERFAAFIAGLWGQVGRVPVVYGQIGAITTTTFPYRDEVQAEQVALNLGACVGMVRTDDLQLQADETHFTVASAQTVGRRMAQRWLSIVPNC